MSDVKPLLTRSDVRPILLVEDDSARPHRRFISGSKRTEPDRGVTVRLHKIVEGEWQTVCGEAQVASRQTAMEQRDYKQAIALRLLGRYCRHAVAPIVVAGPSYGASPTFTSTLTRRKLDFTIEIRPSHQVRCRHRGHWIRRKAADMLRNAAWRVIDVALPKGQPTIAYSAADLGAVCLPDNNVVRLFVAQTGGIEELHRGTIIGLTSLRSTPLKDLVGYVGWVRWIRPVVRRQEKQTLQAAPMLQRETSPRKRRALLLHYRSNITNARRQDKASEREADALSLGVRPARPDFCRRQRAECRRAVRWRRRDGTRLPIGRSSS